MTESIQHYDVFNGDADGLCALQQLRLADPQDSILISGVKRDIQLLDRLNRENNPTNAFITCLDVSFDANREAVDELLQQGNYIRYFDHHFSGRIPSHPTLETHIDHHPQLCTGLLVDQFLKGAYRPWAVVAAFGDNMFKVAESYAETLKYDKKTLNLLKELGTLLNYNSYGETEADLHFTPVELRKKMAAFHDPVDFALSSLIFTELQTSMQEDLVQALEIEPEHRESWGLIYRLPTQAWSRRVAGIFANATANQHPNLAIAVALQNANGTLSINVRAPINAPYGADHVVQKFKTGGGRAAAAGINQLPEEGWDTFVKAMKAGFHSAGFWY